MSWRTSIRLAPASRMVPAGSSALATATSSSERKTTAFCVSAYVAMGSLRRPLYRIGAGRGEDLTSAATAQQGQGEPEQRAGQRHTRDFQDLPAAIGRGRLEQGRIVHRDRNPRRVGALVQVGDRVLDDVPVDAALVVGIAEEQRVVAQGVDDPRNAARVLRDSSYGPLAEQTRVVRARSLQAAADVALDLRGIQRAEPAPSPGRGPEALQSRVLEPGLELG